MTERHQNGIPCSQFEALLPDALDHALSAEMQRAFQAHAEVCPACGPLFREAQEGMLWLRDLEEAEPPANLVHNILAATSAAEKTKEKTSAPGMPLGWAVRWWKAAQGMVRVAMQPRFATSFSMAFFSLSLTLTLAGIKFKDITRVDWHPSSIGKAVMIEYTQVESKVVRYYKNMRLVYEIESRVGELRKNSVNEEKNQPPAQEQPKEKKKRDSNDTSGRPEQRQDNYSRETDDALIAYLTPSQEGANQ